MDIKEMDIYSESSINAIDETIQNAYKLIEELEQFRDFLLQKIEEKKLADEEIN